MSSQINHGVTGPMWKPEKRGPKPPRPIPKTGKVTRARAADKRRKLKDEPARYDNKRQCYICLHWHEHIALEHVFDGSERQDLRHHPANHKWACGPCNSNKKLRLLSVSELHRVNQARLEVLRRVDENLSELSK